MFHLFNSVYLSEKSFFGSVPNCALIGDGQQLPPEKKNVKQYRDWAEFVAQELGEDENAVWEYLMGKADVSRSFTLFLPAEILIRLQCVYWKNILANAPWETGYTLHKIQFEDSMLRLHLPEHVMKAELREGFRHYKLMSAESFKAMWRELPVVPFLAQVSKDCLSFEFQLADYFVNPHTSVKGPLLKKVGHYSWVNWVSEIFILKTDIINAVLDVNRLLPDGCKLESDEPGTLYSQMLGNKYLSWVFDDQIHPRNYLYVEKAYPKEIFKQLYDRFYNLWQVNGEDMSELIDMIYSYQYEELLLRDVRRQFGSVYSSNRFQDRINQVLVSYLYKLKREGNIEELKVFTLTKL